MLTLIPSMSVGLVGSVLTAIALTADWYIWAFRYRISRLRGPELGPPADGKDVIHVPSASGRELVVNPAPQSLDRNIPPARELESEWLDLREQGQVGRKTEIVDRKKPPIERLRGGKGTVRPGHRIQINYTEAVKAFLDEREPKFRER